MTSFKRFTSLAVFAVILAHADAATKASDPKPNLKGSAAHSNHESSHKQEHKQDHKSAAKATISPELEHSLPSATAVYQIVDGKLVTAGHTRNDEVGLLGNHHTGEMKQADGKASNKKVEEPANQWFTSTPALAGMGAACLLVVVATLLVKRYRSRATAAAASTEDAAVEEEVPASASSSQSEDLALGGWTPGSML